MSLKSLSKWKYVPVIPGKTTIDSSSAAALAALNGLFVDPESYYVNLHTTVNPAGVIRAQLATETSHFRPAMGPAAPSTACLSWRHEEYRDCNPEPGEWLQGRFAHVKERRWLDSSWWRGIHTFDAGKARGSVRHGPAAVARTG